jgi:hypothetical protein
MLFTLALDSIVFDRYHGRILLPAEYPFKPPHLIFLTVTRKKKPCVAKPTNHLIGCCISPRISRTGASSSIPKYVLASRTIILNSGNRLGEVSKAYGCVCVCRDLIFLYT